MATNPVSGSRSKKEPYTHIQLFFGKNIRVRKEMQLQRKEAVGYQLFLMERKCYSGIRGTKMESGNKLRKSWQRKEQLYTNVLWRVETEQ